MIPLNLKLLESFSKLVDPNNLMNWLGKNGCINLDKTEQLAPLHPFQLLYRKAYLDVSQKGLYGGQSIRE